SLMILAGRHAEEVRNSEEAVQIAQTKLAEVAAGAIDLTSQGDSPLEEDETWSYSIDCEAGAVEGLWTVTVHVSRLQADGEKQEYCALTQMGLDPSLRGSTQDATTVAGSSGTSSPDNSSSSSGGSTGSTSGGSSSSGSGASTKTPSGGGTKPSGGSPAP